jgi:hypothetical protein
LIKPDDYLRPVGIQFWPINEWQLSIESIILGRAPMRPNHRTLGRFPLRGRVLSILVGWCLAAGNLANGDSNTVRGGIGESQGRAEALGDISHHIYGIKVRGDEKGLEADWIQLLANESLEIDPVSPDYPHRADYIRGYNEAMRAALKSRYGYDLFERKKTEAREASRLEEIGVEAAKADMKKGHFKIISIGYPPDWATGFWNALWSRYRVQIDERGCESTYKELVEAKGYNEAVREAIEKKYGKDVISQTEKEFEPKGEVSDAYKKGAQAATDDLAKGILKDFDATKEPKWEVVYGKILNSYGIKVEDWDEAAAKFGSMDYCSGYNSVSNVAIIDKFGYYFFERANHDAQREFNDASKAQ